MSHDNIPSDPWRTDQFLLYAMQGKALLSYSRGTVPALKIYSNVAIKRRPQVNTDEKSYILIFHHLQTQNEQLNV